MIMNVTNIKYFCTTNGDGFRTSVFVAGCNLHCKGCFNKAAWGFNAGKEMDQEMINKILDSLEPDYIEGLSILGGEPMDVMNQQGVLQLIDCVRYRYGNKKDIWLWTGYELENIPDAGYKTMILNQVDYIVDGPYKHELSDLNIRYRGSSNQKIHDMKRGVIIN